jgi:hypothetical protein
MIFMSYSFYLCDPIWVSFRNIVFIGILLLAVVAGCAGRHEPAETGTAHNDVALADAGVVSGGVERPPLPKEHAAPSTPRRVASAATEPAAFAAREKAIRQDADVIKAECQRAAAGDWEKWQENTLPYRASLLAKIEALRRPGAPAAPWLEALAARDDFPLFEVTPRDGVKYLYAPRSLDEFRRGRSVLAAHRWLRDRGIDLIFVPVPKMTEVYVEHFLDPCPADGIIAPHVRHAWLELLGDGVEVVDAWPILRKQRNSGNAYLYNPADSHWAPAGMQPVAREIAERIARYKFGAAARSAVPIVTSALAPYDVYGPEHGGGPMLQNGWTALNSEQKERAKAALTKTWLNVTMPDGKIPPDDPGSPVILIGNSYTLNFREILIKELNLLIRTNANGAQTTESFGDFLRDPKLLEDCRVMVWVTSGENLPQFKPLPPPIATAAYGD